MSDEIAQVKAELAAIAKHLPGWTPEPNACYWSGSIVNGDGRGLHFNFTEKRGRIVISGHWPESKDRQRFYPRNSQNISVARDKAPEKIAADIVRRFLPWYDAAYAEQVKLAEGHDTYKSKQASLTDTLAALVPGSRRPSHNGGADHQFDAHNLDVEVSGDDVTIKIRWAKPGVAKAVLLAYVKAGGLNQ